MKAEEYMEELKRRAKIAKKLEAIYNKKMLSCKKPVNQHIPRLFLENKDPLFVQLENYFLKDLVKFEK